LLLDDKSEEIGETDLECDEYVDRLVDECEDVDGRVGMSVDVDGLDDT